MDYESETILRQSYVPARKLSACDHAEVSAHDVIAVATTCRLMSPSVPDVQRQSS